MGIILHKKIYCQLEKTDQSHLTVLISGEKIPWPHERDPSATFIGNKRKTEPKEIPNCLILLQAANCIYPTDFETALYMDHKKIIIKNSSSSTVLLQCTQWHILFNRPFYWYGGHIEFIRFKEYYGMPRGHSLSFYTRFLGKKRTSLYISWEKGDYYYIQTWLNDLFYHYNLFLRKT